VELFDSENILHIYFTGIWMAGLNEALVSRRLDYQRLWYLDGYIT
jgi:hypothetical protein